MPTIRRLLGAGASNVHTFVSKHVIDTSGRFNDKDGEPLRYSGHWSWITSLIMRQYLIVVELGLAMDGTTVKIICKVKR
ncbi:MAG: hypothetical protein ACLRQF_00785 [Thomasclavelia ramosa]